MKIERVKISEVKPNPNNPRIIKDDKFRKLVKSIQEFPEMLEIRPIVVNQDMIVLGGNMRLKACKEAGLKEVPIIYADNLTEDQQREFIIKDNVSGGEWDWEVLANEWDAELLDDWGLDLPEVEEIKVLEAEEDNYEIPDEIKTDIVLGDLFEIGEHRLLCGDSTQTDEWAKIFGDESADLVITDPPYNVNYADIKSVEEAKLLRKRTDGLKIENDKQSDSDFYQFLYDFYTALGSYTKPGGAWYVWHTDNESINFRLAFNDSGLFFHECLIWVKNTMVLGRLDYHKKHETCLYGWKPGAGHYFTSDRTKTTVIEDTIDIKKLSKAEMADMLKNILSDKTTTSVLRADKPSKSELHPTMKPVLLISQLVENSSQVGELIADAFLGSGTTMVAAHQLKRKCYGMELDPKYCEVIVQRMHKLDPSLQIKRNGQPYQPKQ